VTESAATAALSGNARVRGSLLARALEKCGHSVEVLTMQPAFGGNSRETWIADVRMDGSAQTVVLRCDPDHWIRPEEMRREIAGLQLAAFAGVPAPRVLAAAVDTGEDRPYVVTEFVAGTAVPRRVLRDPEFATARSSFARQCGQVLARLHGARAAAADWPAPNPLEELTNYAHLAVFESPVLIGALRWLGDHRPVRDAVCPVHRDFRLGNLMINIDGIAAVLDWETCHLSDPEEDLAWLCSRAWRYGASLPVGGIGTLEELLSAYETESGRHVDPTRLYWWSVYAETRWGLASITKRAAGGPGDALENAAIVRRGCLQERNVLLALEPSVTA
jgi:aminoglycoside phosphotransferase (APT) family kinase protein